MAVSPNSHHRFRAIDQVKKSAFYLPLSSHLCRKARNSVKIRHYILVAALILAFAHTIRGADCWWCDTRDTPLGLCDTVSGAHPSGKTICGIQITTQECATWGNACKLESGSSYNGSGGWGGGGEIVALFEEADPCANWWYMECW